MSEFKTLLAMSEADIDRLFCSHKQTCPDCGAEMLIDQTRIWCSRLCSEPEPIIYHPKRRSRTCVGVE